MFKYKGNFIEELRIEIIIMGVCCGEVWGRRLWDSINDYYKFFYIVQF